MNTTTIINSVSTLDELMNTKLKIGTSYKIKKNIDEVNIIVEQFQTKRKELLEQYGTLNEAQTEYEFENDDQREQFTVDMDGYLKEDIDFDFKKINISELENVEIEPSKLGFIDWMIEG